MKTGYICEHCKTFYEKPLEAEGCETKHIEATEGEIVAATYERPMRHDETRAKYPRSLRIKFGGWIAHYSCDGGHSESLDRRSNAAVNDRRANPKR